MTNDQQTSRPNVTLSNPLHNNTFEIQDQTLIESLEREVIVASGQWTSSDTEISNRLTSTQLEEGFSQPALTTIKFPDSLLTSNFIAAKLRNVAFMSADVETTLKVQGTPFLQGALWMWQLPYDKVNTDRTTANEHLRSITSFPGVELNLLDETRTVTLTVPYTNEYQYINPFDTAQNLAAIRLSVLSALDGSDDNSIANYTILARFKNIKLYGHNISQATFARCQAEDEDASQHGIVTKVSHTVADIADAVSGIPILSNIAKPISWVSRAVGKVASMFGFSKALDLEKVTVYANVPGKGFTNVEGIDNSVNLSAMPDNAVSPSQTTFEKEDEMSIAYIAKRPYVIDRVDWNTDQAAGTILGAISVHPCNFANYGEYLGSFRALFTAPIGFVASLFRYWRGQMNIKLKSAKTQFHQGRLLVQYLPYSDIKVAPVEEVLSQIIDLSEMTSEGIDINFPLVSRNKWLSTYSPQETASPFDIDITGGVIVVSVLNPLLGTPTVSDSVRLYGWVHWSDFEVAEPGTSMRVWNTETVENKPILPSTMQAATASDSLVDVNWRSDDGAAPEDVRESLNLFIRYRVRTQLVPVPDQAYAGTFKYRLSIKTACSEEYIVTVTDRGASMNPTVNYPADFPFTNSTDYYIQFLAECQDAEDFIHSDNSKMSTTMGEMITSLRALTRRFTFTSDISPDNPNPISLNFQTPTKSTSRQSVFEIISWLYRFTTGGVRAKIIGQEDIVMVSTTAGANSNKSADVMNSNSASHIQDFKVNPIMEVQLPFYSPAELLAVGSTTFSANNYKTLSQMGIVPLNGNKEYNYKLLLAASDDQNFTFLVGPPAFFVGPEISFDEMSTLNAH